MYLIHYYYYHHFLYQSRYLIHFYYHHFLYQSMYLIHFYYHYQFLFKITLSYPLTHTHKLSCEMKLPRHECCYQCNRRRG